MTIGGPFLAGYLADNHGVRSVFWFVFAASALGGILTLLLVPETPVRVKARIDWLGAVLLAGGLAAILLGLTQAQTWQWGDPRTLGVPDRWHGRAGAVGLLGGTDARPAGQHAAALHASGVHDDGRRGARGRRDQRRGDPAPDDAADARRSWRRATASARR